MAPTLVILAAGLSSRYGTMKQLEPIGPSGEALLDYAVYDAARAGFSKVVCVVRPDTQSDIQRHFADGPRKLLPVEFVNQEVDRPGAVPRPDMGRQKPWGTGHAILSAAKNVHGPFVSVNADDFYGADSYRLLGKHFEEYRTESSPVFGLVGFPLRDTLSPVGGVSRGICRSDHHGFLEELTEATQIVAASDGRLSGVTDSGDVLELSGDAIVSMSIWGFTPDVFPMLQAEFNRFCKESNDLDEEEFLASHAVSALIERGNAQFKVWPSHDAWVGITHPGDRAFAAKRLRVLTARGVYPSPLFGRRGA